MKKKSPAFAYLILAALFALACNAVSEILPTPTATLNPATATPQAPSVAKVNETYILAADFQIRVNLQRQQLLLQYDQLASLSDQYRRYAQSTGMDLSQQIQQLESQKQQAQQMLDAPETLGQAVLDAMVNEEIIRQEAAQRGVTATEQEIDEYIRILFGYFPGGTPTAPPVVSTPTLLPESQNFAPTLVSPGAAATPTAIAVTSTPYTEANFNEAYKQTLAVDIKIGLTEEQYRDLVKVQILTDKLKEIVTADVPVEQEQVWARHIMVADEASALAVIERLNNGEDFGALAVELSQDRGSAVNGGDLGWFGRDMMVAPFERAAFAIQVGEISVPVKTQFGFHVIQVLGKQNRPLSQQAWQSAKDKAFTTWQIEARVLNKIKIYDWKEYIPTPAP